jgi:hypothetical protein
VCCAWPCDRRALAAKYAIADTVSSYAVLGHCAMLLSCCSLVPCLLIQELNHVKAVSLTRDLVSDHREEETVQLNAPPQVGMGGLVERG